MTNLLIEGRVSIRGFLWYLSISILFWEQINKNGGHCIPENFKSNRALVLYVLCSKSGCGIYTSVLSEVKN